MSDFPIGMKLAVWGIIGLTVLYTLWSIFQSLLSD
jgi:hypothetical protein